MNSNSLTGYENMERRALIISCKLSKNNETPQKVINLEQGFSNPDKLASEAVILCCILVV
jgi:hypothetical protein